MAYVNTAYAGRVTIFSTGSKFRPGSNFTIVTRGASAKAGFARVEQVLACARLRTRESHAHACYLTCDLYCIADGKRNRLLPEKVEMLLFLRKNLLPVNFDY